jgi:hypothetical protein
VLFFLCKGTTCASLSLSGNVDVSHFHTFLSAFRKGYGCQTALLKVIENWKKALDQNKYVAAILMDLSKAFEKCESKNSTI